MWSENTSSCYPSHPSLSYLLLSLPPSYLLLPLSPFPLLPPATPLTLPPLTSCLSLTSALPPLTSFFPSHPSPSFRPFRHSCIKRLFSPFFCSPPPARLILSKALVIFPPNIFSPRCFRPSLRFTRRIFFIHYFSEKCDSICPPGELQAGSLTRDHRYIHT